MNQDKISTQLDSLQRTLNDVLLLMLCKEGFSTEQIRAVVGKIDNNRLAKLRAGLAANK